MELAMEGVMDWEKVLEEIQENDPMSELLALIREIDGKR